jgi:HEPN domain-containing protein
MKLMTAEWVAKAEGDFYTLERESRARKKPNYDGICFHAQQCAEKYIKARLSEAGIAFTRVHDLMALLEQVLPVESSWENYRADLAFLTHFGVAFRYPGEFADKELAKEALKRCQAFRKAARSTLMLETCESSQ